MASAVRPLKGLGEMNLKAECWSTSELARYESVVSYSGALAFDRGAEPPVPPRDLGVLWRGLIRGEAKVVRTFLESGRFGMTLRWGSAGAAEAVPPNQIEALEKLFQSGQAKVVSIDSGRSISTVATRAKGALAHMGLSCVASRVPLLLLVAARAACVSAERCPVSIVERADGDGTLQTLTLHGPELWLGERLTRCQRRVARYRLEAKSYDEVAALCGTSVRTVANQLAAVHQTLGVAGGFAMRLLVAEEYLRGNVSAPADDGVLVRDAAWALPVTQ
jgi:hypothetical protein